MTAIAKVYYGAGGGAPTNAYYWLKTADGALPNGIPMDAIGGPGFVVVSAAGVPSVDNTAYLSQATAALTYLTIATAALTYQPLISEVPGRVLYSGLGGGPATDAQLLYNDVSNTLTTGTAILSALTTNGFVKTGGGVGTLFIDSSTYLTTASAAATYQPIGNYITALTGDVTASGPGSVAATIANGAVTLPKMANFAAVSLMGNPTGGAAAPSAITLGANLSFVGSTLVASAASGAPTTATYITQTPDAGLSAEQAMSASASGLVANTTGTGVLTTIALTNTDVLYATGTNTVGQNANFTFTVATTTLNVPVVQAPAFQGDSGGGAATQIRNDVTDDTHVSLSTTQVSIKGNTVPSATATYDLGGSAALWSHVFATNLVASSTVYSIGSSLNLQNDSGATGGSLFLDATTIGTQGDIIPTASATDDIGSSTALYNHAWAATMHAVNYNGFVGATPISFTDNAGNLMMQFSGNALTMSGTAWGVFGSNAVQQTGGAATAGATYTATEQGMINRMYTALRAYALIT